DREMRAPVAEPEKNERRARLDLIAPLCHRLPIERQRPLVASERLQVAQGQDARLRVAEQRGDPLAVIAALAGPIQRIPAEAVDVLHGGGQVSSFSPTAPSRRTARSRRSAGGAGRRG